MERWLEGFMGEICIAVVSILLIVGVMICFYGLGFTTTESSPGQKLWVITHLILPLALISYITFRVILMTKFPDSFGWLLPSKQTRL